MDIEDSAGETVNMVQVKTTTKSKKSKIGFNAFSVLNGMYENGSLFKNICDTCGKKAKKNCKDKENEGKGKGKGKRRKN